MSIGLMNFQPETFEQANPINAGMLSMNDIISGMLKNQAARVQNQYLEPGIQQQLLAQQLANQRSQATLPYAGPMAQAQLTTEQAQPNLMGAEAKNYLAEASRAPYENQMSEAQTNLLRQTTPALIQQENEKVYSDPILNRLYQLNQARQTNAIPASLLSSALGVNSQTPISNSNFDNGTQSLITPTLNQGGNALQNYVLYGVPVNPLQFQAAQKNLDTQATKSVDEWNKGLNDANQQAQDATDLDYSLDQFKNAYDNTTESGPVYGRIPALTTDSQQADNASRNLQLELAKNLHLGRITNMDMQIIGGAKLGRNLTPDSTQRIYDYFKAKNQRIREYQQFLDQARNIPGMDRQTADTLFQKYNAQNPIYDWSKNKVLANNLNKFSNYLTPSAINKIKTPSDTSSIQSSKYFNGKLYNKINGKWYEQ